jgi:hypothetical protein
VESHLRTVQLVPQSPVANRQGDSLIRFDSLTLGAVATRLSRRSLAFSRSSPVRIDPERGFSLAELIDPAEATTPKRVLRGKALSRKLAHLGVARSELFPTLAAVALAGVDRVEALAQCDLQAVPGAEQIALGDLPTALAASASTPIRVQPLSE